MLPFWVLSLSIFNNMVYSSVQTRVRFHKKYKIPSLITSWKRATGYMELVIGLLVVTHVCVELDIVEVSLVLQLRVPMDPLQ